MYEPRKRGDFHGIGMFLISDWPQLMLMRNGGLQSSTTQIATIVNWLTMTNLIQDKNDLKNISEQQITSNKLLFQVKE